MIEHFLPGIVKGPVVAVGKEPLLGQSDGLFGGRMDPAGYSVVGGRRLSKDMHTKESATWDPPGDSYQVLVPVSPYLALFLSLLSDFQGLIVGPGFVYGAADSGGCGLELLSRVSEQGAED